MNLLGQIVHTGRATAWSVGDIATVIIVIVAIIAIVVIFVKTSGVAIPGWIWQIIAVVACAFLAILAIRFLEGM